MPHHSKWTSLKPLGIADAVSGGNMAKNVRELKVWQRAREFVVAVNATLESGGFRNDKQLRDQIRDASDSVVANIAEGFEQPTDRAFVRYLYIAQASNAEARTRLQLANDRRYVADEQLNHCDRIADEVARMLTGLIKYLSRCDLKDRRQGARQPAPQSSKTED